MACSFSYLLLASKYHFCKSPVKLVVIQSFEIEELWLFSSGEGDNSNTCLRGTLSMIYHIFISLSLIPME